MTQAKWGLLVLGCAAIVVLSAACQNPVSSGSSSIPKPPYLYVANYGSSSGANGICAFSIGSGGALSPISLTSSNSTTGANPWGIAISPSGHYLYVANVGSSSGTNGISAFSIGAGGALSPIALTTPGSTTGAHPLGIAISPNGDYLYVINSGSSSGTNGISAFSIGSGGALTPISSTSSTTGANPWGIAISPNGQFLYVINNATTGTNGITAFSIGTGGTLSPLTLTSSGSTTGPHPLGVAISPHGDYLYVSNNGSSNGANGISAFSITSASASDGTLSPLTLTSSESTTGPSPAGLAISPNGSYLYVVNAGSTKGANGIFAFSIGTGGSLSPVALTNAGSTTGTNPEGIAVSPDGAYLYVTNELSTTGANGISAFSIGSDGTLTPISLTSEGSTTGASPLGIAIVN